MMLWFWRYGPESNHRSCSLSTVFDRLAQSVPSSPKGLSEQQIKQSKYILYRAVACVDEGLNSCP